ncbi:MAG: YvrJ family protein [Desulfobacteria bacterium]
MNDLVDWISNQGFAIAVAGYLLLRLEQKMDRLIDLIEKLVKTS